MANTYKVVNTIFVVCSENWDGVSSDFFCWSIGISVPFNLFNKIRQKMSI